MATREEPGPGLPYVGPYLHALIDLPCCHTGRRGPQRAPACEGRPQVPSQGPPRVNRWALLTSSLPVPLRLCLLPSSSGLSPASPSAPCVISAG